MLLDLLPSKVVQKCFQISLHCEYTELAGLAPRLICAAIAAAVEDGRTWVEGGGNGGAGGGGGGGRLGCTSGISISINAETRFCACCSFDALPFLITPRKLLRKVLGGESSMSGWWAGELGVVV